jgi:hypothetical protein
LRENTVLLVLGAIRVTEADPCFIANLLEVFRLVIQ